jgi:hypothetical protein
MRGGGKNVFHVLLVGEEKAFSKDGYFKVRNYLGGQWSGMDEKLLLRGLGHDVKKINYFSFIQILKERLLISNFICYGIKSFIIAVYTKIYAIECKVKFSKSVQRKRR